jgi:nitrate reductase NapAB chaperone NapD
MNRQARKRTNSKKHLGAIDGANSKTSETKMKLVLVVDQHNMKTITHPSIPSLFKEVTSAY